MIVNKGNVRYKILKLRKAKPLGAYLVQAKLIDVPMFSYRDMFYADTEEVALAQINKRHAIES